jgi:peptidoglycan/LPS O-acetylase OafA/YrhL
MSNTISEKVKSLSKSPLRADLQALRALAVLGVLVYHMNPAWLTGGLVGVDVFFVLSGFLISSHLIGELYSKGKIELGKFWSRRARRLLPASMLVLAATAIGVITLVPESLKNIFFRDITAATLYGANWVFAADSTDYFANEGVESPVMHFWSLGVEEQFYLIWPILLISGWFILGKFLPKRLALISTIMLVSIPSFILAAVMVSQNDASAYFVTTTRVWEFGAGALIGILLAKGNLKVNRFAMKGNFENLKAFAWTAGWITIISYMFLFKTEYGFPGINALVPVVATMFIILGNDPVKAGFLNKIVGLRPIQYIGEISYSVYLWHWTALVFTPYLALTISNSFLGERILSILGEEKSALLLGNGGMNISDLTWLQIVIIVPTIFILSWLTTSYVENPIRFSKRATTMRPRSIFLVTGLSMLVLIGGVQAANAVTQQNISAQAASDSDLADQLAALIESGGVSTEEPAESGTADESTGASEGVSSESFVDNSDEPTESVENDAPISAGDQPPSNVTPATPATKKPSNGAWNAVTCMGPAFLVQPDCKDFTWETSLPAMGVKEGNLGNTDLVWTGGDYRSCFSFSEDYAVKECIYGTDSGVKKIALVGDSHAFHWLPAFNAMAKKNNYELHFFARAGCPLNFTPRVGTKQHVDGCKAWTTEANRQLVEGNFDTVVISNYANTTFSSKGYSSEVAAGTAGYVAAWKDIVASGAEVVILRDNPFIGTKTWNCAVANPTNLSKCSTSESNAFNITDERIAAAKDMNLRVVDMTKYFCKAGTCPVSVGGIRIYADSNHISKTYNLLLTPYLEKELARK